MISLKFKHLNSIFGNDSSFKIFCFEKVIAFKINSRTSPRNNEIVTLALAKDLLTIGFSRQ